MKKTILFCGCLCLALIFLFYGCKPSKDVLHVYTWADYIKPELIRQFEEENGCRVVIDTFDSNEAMYAKLKAGASGYDVLFPTSYIVELMLEQDMLLPIDFAQITNQLFIEYSRVRNLGEDVNKYGVPYSASYTGLAYRIDKVKDFKATWNEFARTDLRHRMTMLNDMRETLGAALKYLGYSINARDQKEIDAAVKVLLDWKKNLAKFDSEQYKNGIASAEYLLVQGYSGDILQVMQENENVAFELPVEGGVVAYDYMVIPKSSNQPVLAHSFINFLQDPDVAAANMQFTLYPSLNQAAYNLLPEEFKKEPALFPSPEVLKNMEPIRSLGTDIEMYQKAWDKVKA